MELREYMSIRRAYNLVRQKTDTARRLTFEEYAILCRLELSGVPIKTSEIADYQGALRPTMTHRTNHLASLGLIDRGEGIVDRRNIICSISEDGKQYVRVLSDLTRGKIPNGQPLARISADRLCKYVDAMGTVYCTAGELVLLSLYADDGQPSTVTGLVDRLGLLQPTVSMSVGSMVEKGLVERVRADKSSPRALDIELTAEGRERAKALAERVYGIVVRRRSRAEKQ